MAGYDGNGTFTKSINWVDDKNNNIKIRADRHDTVDNEFVSGFNLVLTRDGQGIATANLPMGGFKHTGVDDATSADEYSTLGQIQTQDGVYFVTTGSSNAYVLGVSPAITAYAAGQRFLINASFANTGAATINISGLGAKSLYYGGNDLLAGDIQSGQIVEIIYNGTEFDVSTALNQKAMVFRGSMAAQVFN